MTQQTPIIEDGYFFLHSKDQAERFTEWLKTRNFNTIRTDLYDRRNQPIIGLSWRDAGGVDKRGVIGCADEAMRDWACQLAKQSQGAGVSA